MELLFFVLFLLLSGVVIWALNCAIKKLSYPIEKRYLHIRLIISLILSMLVLTNVYTSPSAVKLLNKLISIPSVSRFFSMIFPLRAYEISYMILTLILYNIGIMVSAAVVISITKLVFKRREDFVYAEEYTGIAKVFHFPWLIVAKFYEEGENGVRLTDRGFNLGIWASGAKLVFAAVFAAEILVAALSVIWGGNAWNEMVYSITKFAYVLPLAAFLVAEQIQFFFECDVRVELGTYGTTELEGELKGDLDAITKLYRDIFEPSGVLLHCESSAESTVTEMGLGSNDLGNRQIADCKQPVVLAVISNQLRQCGVTQCDEYQNAVGALLNGESINVRDHNAGEFLIYLVSYLNFYIAHGRTALILCRMKNDAEQLYEAVSDAMMRINELSSIWNICDVKEAEKNEPVSILICTFDEVLSTDILKKRKDFANDLFCTVIAGGFDLFSQDSIRIRRLFNELSAAQYMKQYVMISDEDNDALRTTLEMYAKVELVPFRNDRVPADTGIMIWKEESCYKIQRIISVGVAMSPYLGTALPLVLVAAKHDLPEIYVIPENSRAESTFSDVLEMSGREAESYLNKKLNLKSIIRYSMTEAIEEKNIAMIVAYDTDYNFFNTISEWIKYGGRSGTLLHVISPPYMLREFFIAAITEHRMVLKNNEYDALVPHNLGNKSGLMALLLVSLNNGGMTETEIMEKSAEYGWQYESVDKLLSDCLKVILKREELHSIYESFYFEEEKYFDEKIDAFVSGTRITLTDEVVKQRLKDLIEYAVLVHKGNVKIPLPILKGNIYNHYLRDQLAVFNGYLYRIHAIVDGAVYAEQEMPADIFTYYQISELFAENVRLVDECVDMGGLDMNMFIGKVTRNIYGYISSNKGNNFASKENVKVSDIRQDHLTVTDSDAHILQFAIKKSLLGDAADGAATLLAFSLGELFKTLFPANYQNLFACTDSDLMGPAVDDVVTNGHAASVCSMARSIIPNISGLERDGEYASVYVVELSCIDYGLVQTLYNHHDKVLKMLYEYLSWYLMPVEVKEDRLSDMNGDYLHFGTSNILSIFAAGELIGALETFVTSHDEVPVNDTLTIEPTQYCTFCGRPTLILTALSDGRQMCGHCKDHQVAQRDEILDLYMGMVALMTKGYNIKLRKNIHVRFQSADAIRRMFPNVQDGRVLGFYDSTTHALWIEARGPRISIQNTVAHELTHCWQHDNLPLKKLFRNKLKGEREKLLRLLLEGHAVYVEICVMRDMNETEFADRFEAQMLERDDEYGLGYRLIKDVIDDRREAGSHVTPFIAMKEYVDDLIAGKETFQCN